MRYNVGDHVYFRSHIGAGRMKIVGVEFKWHGAVERLAFCKLKSRAGIIRVPVSELLTQGEAVAEKLSKGKIDGCNVGLRKGS